MQDDAADGAGPQTEFRKKAAAVAVASQPDSADVYIPNIPKSASTTTMLNNAVRGMSTKPDR